MWRERIRQIACLRTCVASKLGLRFQHFPIAKHFLARHGAEVVVDAEFLGVIALFVVPLQVPLQLAREPRALLNARLGLRR